MPVTVTQQGILTLIKSAITGEALPLSPAFSMSTVAQTARRHHITALLYEGAVRCGISHRDDPMPGMFQRSVSRLLISEKQLSATQKLFAAFEEAGIDYMPVKGLRMKTLYPKPELRSMADADVLIRLEQYDKIRPILEQQGFDEKVESDHELIWVKKSLYLELHKRLIPSYNPDLYAYFEDPWSMAEREHGHCWSMRVEDEWLYIFTHMAKHYRDGGIGLRHLTDLLVFRRAHPVMDEGYIRTALERLELTEFYRHICRLLDYWFGGAPGDSTLEMMTEFIFTSGSFGTADSHTVSMMLRKIENSRIGNAKLLYILNNLFPGKSVLEVRYPVLGKCPWLLPVIWVVRPFQRIWKNPHLLHQKQKDLKTITDEKIDNRRRSLKLVGLDFRF